MERNPFVIIDVTGTDNDFPRFPTWKEADAVVAELNATEGTLRYSVRDVRLGVAQ